MNELYYVTISCESQGYYELMADSEEEAKEKAWNIALKEIPNADHPIIHAESQSERREQEEFQEFLDWKKNREDRNDRD